MTDPNAPAYFQSKKFRARINAGVEQAGNLWGSRSAGQSWKRCGGRQTHHAACPLHHYRLQWENRD